MSLHQTPQYHRKAVVRQDPKEEVTNLKQQPGKDSSISGSGKRLFEDGGDQRALELVDSKTFGTGVLYLTYQLEQS
jgi:hypothetical protein